MTGAAAAWLFIQALACFMCVVLLVTEWRRSWGWVALFGVLALVLAFNMIAIWREVS